MKPRASLLKSHHVELATVRAVPDRIREIAADLAINGGALVPTSNWVTLDVSAPVHEDGLLHVEESFTDASVTLRMSTMEKMLRSWIGCHQIPPADGAVLESYRSWFQRHDPLGLWSANFSDPLVASRLTIADLGSAMDLTALWSFLPSSERDQTLILEVGGGYGRLAEAAMNIFDGVKYVLVDGVPASLHYAREYLARACPDSTIGFYYDGDPFDLDMFDIYIVPSWHFEKLNRFRYDVCLNIESFQEMSVDQVVYFLERFDDLSAPGTLFMVSNFKELSTYDPGGRMAGSTSWAYPAGWRHAFSANTPRSTYPDHPIDILIKEEGDDLPGAQMRAAQNWAAERRRQQDLTIAAEAIHLITRTYNALGDRIWRR